MRKLKYIVLLIVCFVFQTSFAQTPQKVVSFVQVEHDTGWYKQQAEAWKKVLSIDKHNEAAWKNYYRATRYELFNDVNMKDYNSANARLEKIMQDMKKAIPDSYTYNALMYYHNGNDLRKSSYIVKAIAMRPDEVDFFPDYVSFASLSQNDTLLINTCKKWYESGKYSAGLLNYDYNEMAGMEKDGIIFANGDNSIYPKLLLQYGKNLFKDKKLICLPFLYEQTYRERVLKELGVPSFPGTDKELSAKYPANNQLSLEIAKHIIKYTNRPVYFSAMGGGELDSFKDSLYSEGLVMKYSSRPYDNLAVTKRNYEQTYLLDYFKDSFTPDGYKSAVGHINLNYVTGFRSLLEFYRVTGDLNNYTKLKTQLHGIVDNYSFDNNDSKNEYLKCLEPSGK
ncbi:hypothetical protein [uncultured Bacteroides sp.]|uniref:hypothetical protein n=1 Tax=uncultured Bacteroides sp. TaxID=162156 RepID=UPI002AAB398B|nr:hypothetical protein [uncultured Bacteroides sp.]